LKSGGRGRGLMENTKINGQEGGGGDL
jgi:hypothetical protein